MADWNPNGDKQLAAVYDQITDPNENANALIEARDPDALPTAAVTVLSDVSRDTYAFYRDVTCVAAVVKPLLPAPDPDSLTSSLPDSGENGIEIAKDAAESAADKIKQARRLGPSRLARIAKLEHEAEFAGKAAKAFNIAGYALAAPEVYENAKQYCTEHK